MQATFCNYVWVSPIVHQHHPFYYSIVHSKNGMFEYVCAIYESKYQYFLMVFFSHSSSFLLFSLHASLEMLFLKKKTFQIIPAYSEVNSATYQNVIFCGFFRALCSQPLPNDNVIVWKNFLMSDIFATFTSDTQMR